MGNATASSFIFIVQTFGNLYILICLLRVILPLVGVSFINPISQVVVKITDPAIKILRVVLPPIKGVSTAAIFWAYLMQLALALALVAMGGANSLNHIPELAIISIYRLLQNLLDLYFYSLLAVAISSFIVPGSSHPALQIARCITEPVLKPIRKIMPPMGGFDLSVLILFIVINILRIFLQVPFQ